MGEFLRYLTEAGIKRTEEQEKEAYRQRLRAEFGEEALPEIESGMVLVDNPSGNSKFIAGEYKGRTYADVKDNEPEFTDWAARIDPMHASLGVQNFKKYLKSEGLDKEDKEMNLLIR